jgi:hypothetical protein
MIELILFNNVYTKSKDPNEPTLSPQQKEIIMANIRNASVMASFIYIFVFVLALYKAMECSSNTPDSRAIHLFFATVSPVMYIIFAYFVPGFCPTK